MNLEIVQVNPGNLHASARDAALVLENGNFVKLEGGSELEKKSVFAAAFLIRSAQLFAVS